MHKVKKIKINDVSTHISLLNFILCCFFSVNLSTHWVRSAIIVLGFFVVYLEKTFFLAFTYLPPYLFILHQTSKNELKLAPSPIRGLILLVVSLPHAKSADGRDRRRDKTRQREGLGLIFLMISLLLCHIWELLGRETRLLEISRTRKRSQTKQMPTVSNAFSLENHSLASGVRLDIQFLFLFLSFFFLLDRNQAWYEVGL